MSRDKLKNAPLKEVIFELYWELTPGLQGMPPADPLYEIALGSFAERLKNEFPLRKKIVQDGVQLFSRPEYQFWTAEAKWPVIQLGRGIMTVNDTDLNYSWENNFKRNIDFAVRTLTQSYESLPRFNRIKLQYINSIENLEMDSEAFISKMMLTEVRRNTALPGKTRAISISQSYEQDDKSLLTVNIQSGFKPGESKPSVLWTITVERSVTFNVAFIDAWLNRAHNLTSNTFVQILNPEFYERFDK